MSAGFVDVVAAGGNLQPDTLLEAYRNERFPMHVDGLLLWWSPEMRGVLYPSRFHASSSLQRSRRRYQVLTED